MRLTAIEPSDTGHDLRTFHCRECSRVQRHVIKSAVTEAWLAPKRQTTDSASASVADRLDRLIEPLDEIELAALLRVVERRVLHIGDEFVHCHV